MNDHNSIELSPDDFATTEWEQVLDSAGGAKSYDRANAFYTSAREANTQGETRAAAVFQLLGDLCSFRLCPDHPNQPFQAWIVTSTFHSASPEHITHAQAEVLRAVAPGVRDSWLRARMADFVWSFGRGYPMARLAVESYLELAGAPSRIR